HQRCCDSQLVSDPKQSKSKYDIRVWKFPIGTCNAYLIATLYLLVSVCFCTFTSSTVNFPQSITSPKRRHSLCFYLCASTRLSSSYTFASFCLDDVAEPGHHHLGSSQAFSQANHTLHQDHPRHTAACASAVDVLR